MKVIDNFLDNKDFVELKNIILCDEFPWFFQEHSIDPQAVSSPPQFTHNFLKDYRISNYFFCIEKILKKIDHSVMFRIKANLNTKTENIIETGLHTDVDRKGFHSAVFFVNDCDGYCRIGSEKISSEENKLVIFNSSLRHTGTSCTNQSRRVIINFVYKK